MKRPYLSIALLAVLLSGCSYFTAPEGEVIEVERPSGGATTFDITARPGVSEPAPLPMQIDQDVLAQRESGGRVEVFDTAITVNEGQGPEGERFFSAFDGEAGGPMITSNEPMLTTGPVPAQGAGYNFDPSVQIIPLDESMRAKLGLSDTPVSDFTIRRPSASPIETEFSEVLEQVAASEPSSPVTVMSNEEFVTLRTEDDDFIKLFFAHDSDAINPTERAEIARLVKSYANYENALFSIEGHASRRSSIPSERQRKIVNLDKSKDRAFAVSKALIEQGVPADKIRIVAWGESRPASDLEGKTLEEASRRVEIRPLARQ